MHTTKNIPSRSKFPVIALVQGIWRYASRTQRMWLIVYYILAFSTQLVGLLRPLALGWLFEVLETGFTQINSEFIWAVVTYVSLMVGFLALNAPSRVLERRLAFGIRRNFYESMYHQLASYPLEWHQRHHSGDTIDRLRKAGDGLFMFAGSQFRWIQIAMGLVGPIVALSYLSWPIAISVFIADIIILASVARFDQVIVQAIREQNTAEHRFASSLIDYLANMTTILSLRLSGRTQKEVIQTHDAALRPFNRYVIANEAKYSTISILVAILEASALIGFVAIDLATLGRVRIGMSVTVFRYINLLGKTFYEAAYIYQDLIHKRTNYEAVQTLDQPIRSASVDGDLPPKAWRTVSIKNLRYTHAETEAVCLRDLDIDFQAGERVALTGASGAGKSTLLATLRGLREPEFMTVDIDGIRRQDIQSFRAGVVLVPQEPELFDNTFRFNLTGGLACNAEDIADAVHDAELSEVITRAPQGLDTDIRERGVNLSGGERQRLALGRALLLSKNARLLLLDEATSSVDPDTELRIYQHIFRRFQGRTVLASIHARHLLPMFDRVLHMENGRLTGAVVPPCNI